MSRHNIVGSEAFDRQPFVYIRGVRRKRPKAVAIAAGATIGGGALAALGFLAIALAQAAGLF